MIIDSFDAGAAAFPDRVFVQGGVQMTYSEAADASHAVAAALVSALSERPVPAGAVIMGEIALSGEVRPVAHGALRLKEAAKLGFERGWIPASLEAPGAMATTRFGKLGEVVDLILGRG